MPTRDQAPTGAPCWIDLFSSDPDRAVEFYGELFGWTQIEPEGDDFGGYFNFTKDGVLVAGCMRNDGSQGSPDGWNVHLAVDDAQATVEAVAASGGTVVFGPDAIPQGLGTMAGAIDPGGAFVGIWQPGSHKGFGVLTEDGAPAWFELHTRNYDAAVGFYKGAFGWDARTMSDTPEFRYTTLGEGEGALAGIMDSTQYLPAETPAHWAVYFQVDDTDKALLRIDELGGRTIEPGHDTPYGRLGIAADPTGALFRLMANG